MIRALSLLALVPSVALATTGKLGVNLGAGTGTSYGTPVHANAVLDGRRPTSPASNTTAVPEDALGFPTQNFELGVFEGAAAADTYTLRFVGQATINAVGMTLTNQTYNAGTNVTTADVSHAGGNAHFTFTNTKRLPGDATGPGAGQGTGVSDLTLMHSGHMLGVDYIYKPLLAAIASPAISLVRFVGDTSGNTAVVNWSDRTLPTVNIGGDYTTTPRPGYSVSYEMMAQLARAGGKDLWINVYFNASDDYLTKMAQTLKCGSDGVNPWVDVDGVTCKSDPLWPGVAAGTKIYLEYCNELWNPGYPYGTTRTANITAAEASYNAGDPYHYGFSGAGTWGVDISRLAHKTKIIADAFRAVWGDAAMMTRIRPIMAWQNVGAEGFNDLTGYLARVWGGWTGTGWDATTLTYPEDGRANAYGNPAWPMTRYVWGLAHAPYVEWSDDAGVNPNGGYPIATSNAIKALMTKYGVQGTTYEGGPDTSHEAKGSPYLDEASYQITLNIAHGVWNAYGPESTYLHYQLVGDYRSCTAGTCAWGIAPSVAGAVDTQYPRVRALNDLAAEIGGARTLTSIALSPSSATKVVGQTQTFSCTGVWSDGSTGLCVAPVWASSAPAVATVANGAATAVGYGTAMITATYGGVTGTATLDVTTIPTRSTKSRGIKWRGVRIR